MTLTLTVCGCAGTHVGPGRACSSYLVTAAGKRILLDCGNGSLMNLQRCCDVADLDAVVISHRHPDHFADLYSLFYALRFHRTGEQSVPVHAPPGMEAFAAQILGDSSIEAFGDVLLFHEEQAGGELAVGDVHLRFHAAEHPVETLATRIVVDGTVLAYSADSARTPALVECARDADLFVCEATWLERDRPFPPGVHMTGAEAGRTAAEAGAARLMITHVYPTTDPAEVAAEAAGAFDGEILIARDLLEISL